MTRSVLTALSIAIAGCAHEQQHRETIVETPVYLPNHLCATHGIVAVSKDATGPRMLCELKEPLGTHLPKCTCWDERMIAEQRDETQQIVRQITMDVQVAK